MSVSAAAETPNPLKSKFSDVFHAAAKRFAVRVKGAARRLRLAIGSS